VVERWAWRSEPIWKPRHDLRVPRAIERAVVTSMSWAARVGWIARTSGWVVAGVVRVGVAVLAEGVAVGVGLDVVPGEGAALSEQATRAAAARAASGTCHRTAISPP
jgi:hypothetical protein